MKTTAFGVSGLAIVILTIFAVLQLVSGHTRSVNLQDNLQQALESSLETTLNGDYPIRTDDELVADVLEGLAIRLDDNCELDVTVNAIDRTKGLLSVEVTANYMTRHQDTNGDGEIDDKDAFRDLNHDGKLDAQDHVSSVTAERTVLLEEYDVAQAGKHTVNYEIIDNQGVSAMYKKYTLTAGHHMMVPKNPEVNFDGYWYLDGTTKMSRAQIQNLPVDKNYRFTNRKIN